MSEQKEVLSVKEVAEYLGLSESIVRRLVRERRIPFIRIERRVLFFLPAVQQWLTEQIVCPDPAAKARTQLQTQTSTNHVWNKIRGV